MENVWEATFSKLTPFPEEICLCISSGKGVNSMVLTVFPEEAIFPQMLMHKKIKLFLNWLVDLFPKEGFLCISLLINVKFAADSRNSSHVMKLQPVSKTSTRAGER